MDFEIDYTKLLPRALKDLINQGDRKADDEYDRRVLSGEIKTSPITFDEIREMYGKKRAS
jgi:hypothetical protein